MELRHLRYFLAVGEALSFTKAAARLRVAKPALSRQVRDLEDEIGVDLLRRSPRGSGITELVSIGIARATKGGVTPAGEKFCEILRKTSAARAMPER